MFAFHLSCPHQCDGPTSVREFLTQVQHPSPTIIGVIGCGCSVATEPVADIISLYGLPLVSAEISVTCRNIFDTLIVIGDK